MVPIAAALCHGGCPVNQQPCCAMLWALPRVVAGLWRRALSLRLAAEEPRSWLGALVGPRQLRLGPCCHRARVLPLKKVVVGVKFKRT